MFNIPDFARIETTPLTEEDMLNSENTEFAEWFKEELRKEEERQAEAAAAKEAAVNAITEGGLKIPEGDEAATDAA